MHDVTVFRWLLRACDPEGCERLPEVRLGCAQAVLLAEAAREHGVAGTVLRNLRQLLEHDDAAQVLTDPREQPAVAEAWRLAAERCLAEVAQSLLLRARAASLLAAFRRAGVPAAIVKGEDFADRLYELPGLRTFRDIDVLLPRTAVDAAAGLMDEQGFFWVHPAGKYDRDYGERVWDHPGPPRVRVELHWNMITCPSQRRRSTLGWDDLEWLAAGSRLQASPESLLLIACAHAAISHRFDRLQHLCDIRQICRGRAGELRCDAVRELTLRCGLSAAVTGGLEVTSRLLQDENCRHLLARLQLPARQGPWKALVSGASLLAPATRTSKLRQTVIREWLKRSA